MNLHLDFSDPAALRPELSGGKGANLAQLTQRGFAVPPGFIVTAPAYREFARSADALIAEATAWAGAEPAQLRRASERLRGELAAFPLPPAVVAGTTALLAGFPSGQGFAVRSSSTMEDLATSAFAGQHDTFLNVVGVEAVLEKIKACWLSLWQDRAIAYRHQRGFDHRQAAMAVVIQVMIPCEVAGVGFSINPVSGHLGELVIDANFGLGESVVSGEGAVDHFELGKADRVVRRAVIARKTTQVRCAASGTMEATVAPAEESVPCLDDVQLAAVADLLLRVEQSYRFPQDIEWGWAGGQLYLLQSRPVTTIPVRWTRDESAERFPNVVTPLTWDFVESGFNRSLAHSFRLMGLPPCPNPWFGLHGHYVYGNQNVVDLYLKRAPFDLTSLDALRAYLPRLREDYRWVQELPAQWMRDMDDYLLSIGGFMAEELSSKSLGELWRFVLRINERGAEYFRPNIAISITHGTLHHLLQRLVRMVAGADGDRLFGDLLAQCETKTSAVNRELCELVELIRATPALEAELHGDLSSREWLERRALAAFPAVEARLQKFLQDHGHREIDFDLYHPAWADAPWVVLDTLRLMLRAPATEAPALKERELKLRQLQAEQALFGRLPADLHVFFAEILRLARVYTALDDLEHYQTTRLARPLRRALHELGLRLVRRGVFTDPMDVFFAHWSQLDQAIAVDAPVSWLELAALVRKQKAAYLADRARTPEWVLGQGAEPVIAADAVTGLAGSPGVVEGPIYLVRDAEDFARFPKGAVLVARTTNPSWTPLFYSAVAVITESGGPLSHGAVTAREMRIPAVMSVPGCLNRFKNGDRVRVDGTAGNVATL